MTTTETALNGKVHDLLLDQVARGTQIGAQVAAYRNGELIVDTWAGQMGPGDPRPVQPDTLFSSFSTTKGVAATALHILADRGVIEYDAPVATYWPAFAANGKERITERGTVGLDIRQLILRGPANPEHVSAGEEDSEHVTAMEGTFAVRGILGPRYHHGPGFGGLHCVRLAATRMVATGQLLPGWQLGRILLERRRAVGAFHHVPRLRRRLHCRIICGVL